MIDLSAMKPKYLKDWAYETIKSMILNDEVKIGEKLGIEVLAERMAISRTPIREALLKLESEGFVKAAPRVGFFVKGLQRGELTELLELREILEGYAAKKAAERMKQDDLDKLDQFQRESEQAVATGDMKKFLETETAIHGLIQNCSGNTRLVCMIDSIKTLLQRERYLSLQSSKNVKQTLREHSRVIASLKKKDPEKAETAMKDHIIGVKNRILELEGIENG